MPSSIDAARMVPASENDLVNPGSLYLACLNLQKKTDPESYWIVLRAPREWLPDGFFDTRPVQQRVFPFWILGKDQRVWLARTSLFYLDRSQRDIFPVRSTKLEFTNTLILIDSFQNAEAVLTHFKRRILDSTKQYNEQRQRDVRSVARRNRSSSPVVDDAPENSAVVLAQNTGGRTAGSLVARANRVNTSTDAPYRTRSQLQLLPQHPQTIFARAPFSQRQRNRRTDSTIKIEQSDQRTSPTNATMSDSRVTIYIGSTNTIHMVDVTALQRNCPSLHSMISVNQDTGEMFIMHPRLNNVNVHDFRTVLEYIETNEYQPIASGARNGHTTAVALAGHETARDYSETLIKAARLYVLAKQFDVQGMTGLIEQKVRGAAWTSYDNLSVIRFAIVMFTRPVQFFGPGSVEPRPLAFENLDQWAIDTLAASFMDIMDNGIERDSYMSLMEATRERRIHGYVLEKAATDYRYFGGRPAYIID